MIDFQCMQCNKMHRIEEFKTTDTPNVVKVPCVCGHIMQVVPLFDIGVYEIGTFSTPVSTPASEVYC